MADTNVGAPLWVGDARPANSQQGTPGMETTPVFVYSVVPATLQSDNLVTAKIVTGSETLTLVAGTSITTTTINGSTYYALDVPRNLRITGATASVTASVVTVTGKDEYFQTMTETITGPTGTAVTSGAKAFKYLLSATASGNTVSAITVGTGDVFGFPYRVAALGQYQLFWALNWITDSAGFTAAVTTSPATSLTGDVRGTYSSATASNGSRRLTVFIPNFNPDSVEAVYGVTQA